MPPYINHFQTVDPKLYQLARTLSIQKLQKGSNHFQDLANCIVTQQLSGKAGDAIWLRFVTLFKGDITPTLVKEKPLELLRTAGISQRKAEYIHAIADAFLGGEVDEASFETCTDDEVIDTLTKIRGIGRWTAEMFLIFSLGREDVFSTGDLGLRKALQNIYNLPSLPDIPWMVRCTHKWSPYRSYGSLLLWKSLESI